MIKYCHLLGCKDLVFYKLCATYVELLRLEALEVLADAGLVPVLRAAVVEEEGDPTQVLHLLTISLSFPQEQYSCL